MANKHFMFLDLETMSKWSDCVILSVGITIGEYKIEGNGIEDFPMMMADSLYLKFDVREQVEKLGRKYTRDVMDWWNGQEAEAKAVLKPSKEDISLLELNNRIQKYLDERGLCWGNLDIWDRRGFDWPKIQHVYEVNLGFAKAPYPYQNQCDIVQFAKAYGMDPYLGIRASDVPGMVYHNAAADAVLDRIRLIKMFKELGVVS